MITLKDITADNFIECIDMDVFEDQKQFVAPNVFSIAESKIYPESTTKAIYHHETMVGFIMYGRDNEGEDKSPWLIRLMIDKNHQNKQYGKQAMLVILEEMHNKYPNEPIYLSTSPDNVNVIKFYEKFGFKSTGKIQYDELVLIKND